MFSDGWDSRDNKKNRFSNTMAFMEEYLNNVLNDELPFHNEEKNKLTYEVRLLLHSLAHEGGQSRVTLQHGFSESFLILLQNTTAFKIVVSQIADPVNQIWGVREKVN